MPTKRYAKSPERAQYEKAVAVARKRAQKAAKTKTVTSSDPKRARWLQAQEDWYAHRAECDECAYASENREGTDCRLGDELAQRMDSFALDVTG